MVEVRKGVRLDEIGSRIKKAPLLKKDADGKDIFPYVNAEVSVEELDINDFRPTTLYVVRGNLEVQRILSEELLELGEDPLQLETALKVANDEVEFDLIPPIVEEDAEDGDVLLDGAHRVYLARECGIPVVRALVVRGVDPNYPVYARANEWDEVVEYDETPPIHLKKRYRVEDSYSLYRDFTAFSTTTPRSQN